MAWRKKSKKEKMHGIHVNVINLWINCDFPVTADTFLVEGNKQEHQLSNLKPSTSYSVALYATKGPLTSGTVITNLQTRESFIVFFMTKVGRSVASQLEAFTAATWFNSKWKKKKVGKLIRTPFISVRPRSKIKAASKVAVVSHCGETCFHPGTNKV